MHHDVKHKVSTEKGETESLHKGVYYKKKDQNHDRNDKSDKVISLYFREDHTGYAKQVGTVSGNNGIECIVKNHAKRTERKSDGNTDGNTGNLRKIITDRRCEIINSKHKAGKEEGNKAEEADQSLSEKPYDSPECKEKEGHVLKNRGKYFGEPGIHGNNMLVGECRL